MKQFAAETMRAQCVGIPLVVLFWYSVSSYTSDSIFSLVLVVIIFFSSTPML